MTDISYTLVDPRVTLGAGDTRSLYGRPGLRDLALMVLGLAVLSGTAVGVYLGAKRFADVKLRVPILTNAALALVVGGLIAFVLHARRSELWRNAWRQVWRSRLAVGSLLVVSLYVVVALLDSASWCDVEDRPDGAAGAAEAVLSEPRSVLDRMLTPLSKRTEKTFSAPLADKLLSKETMEAQVNGHTELRRDYPPLEYPGWHLLGTDKTGQDVLWLAIKGVRTGMIIGGLTTLIAVPFAIFFGVLAGFFGGWIDDAVQYVYTTLSSIPWILLVVCFVLVFGQGLVQLCVVMGLTGWVGLCRLLRGETLKLREREYVQAALALGVGKFRVLARHVVPNLMHLVLISVVLRFSGLVLAEAVLSYIGMGVGPDVISWGSMVNQARGELGRDPVVWWSLAASFLAMFALVLPANLFADALRDALDPSLRVRGAGVQA
jgi:peptide/nickel transport system permease protein